MLRGSCQKDSGISQTQHPCILEPEMQRNLRNSEGWNCGVFEPCWGQDAGVLSPNWARIPELCTSEVYEFLEAGLLDPLNPGTLELILGNGNGEASGVG